jgi:hypothetical protein
MRFHLCISLAVVGLVLVSCASHPPQASRPMEVIVEQLLVAPSRFSGAHVVVTGYSLMPLVGDNSLARGAGPNPRPAPQNLRFALGNPGRTR